MLKTGVWGVLDFLMEQLSTARALELSTIGKLRNLNEVIIYIA